MREVHACVIASVSSVGQIHVLYGKNCFGGRGWWKVSIHGSGGRGRGDGEIKYCMLERSVDHRLLRSFFFFSP